MMVEMQIMLCSSWSNVRTLTSKTQFASMWFIFCMLQHLAQRGQHTIHWSTLQKRRFLNVPLANMATRQWHPHIDVIKQKKASAACREKGSDHWEHRPACDLKRTSRRRKDRKQTLYIMQRNRNGSRILWRERPLWQESQFRTKTHWLCNIWLVLAMVPFSDCFDYSGSKPTQTWPV